MEIVAYGVEISVGDTKVVIDVAVNEKGNLELLGLSEVGPVYYDLLDEELELRIAEGY